MKKMNWTANQGLSLTEVIVVMAILSIFSIFVANLIITSQNAWLIQHTAMPARAEARQTMEAITKELREADPTAPGGVTIGGVNNSQITFRIPNQVSQTGILSWRQIQIALDTVQQQVTRTENGAATVLGRNAETLQFTLANNTVITTLGTAKAITQGMTTIRSRLSTETKLRN